MIELQEEIKFQKILPYNTENYRAITIERLVFMDSYLWLTDSLDNLMKDYCQRVEKSEMTIINQARRVNFYNKKLGKFELNEKKRDLQLKKCCVPWNLVKTLESIEDIKKLPTDPMKYYSKLTDSTPEMSDIVHGQKYFKTFNCMNLKNYLGYYCEVIITVGFKIIKLKTISAKFHFYNYRLTFYN